MNRSRFVNRHSNPISGITSAILIIVSLLLLFLGALLGIGWWVNNAKTTNPPQIELEQSREKAIGWIKAHESEVLAIDNPALWWMLHDSATLSGNVYLTELYSKYYERYLAVDPTNPWHHLFDHDSKVWIPTYMFDQFPDYNQLFLYGLSCQPSLREVPQVRELMEVDSCGKLGILDYFQNPTCVTHQLLGAHFILQRRCEQGMKTNLLVKALQDKVALEATWDFRGVVDFYLQKVLMLAESGAADRIRPRWLRRVLDAQRPDGGWDNFYELVRLSQDWSFGWSAKGLMWIRHPESNFHTTAQGLYLMSLMSAHASGAIDQTFRASQPSQKLIN